MNLLLRSATARWNQLWFTSDSGRPEAYFRVGYAAVLLLDLLGLRPKLTFLFSNEGILPPGPLDVLYPPAAMEALYWVWLTALVLLIVGYRTRLCAAVNFALTVYVFGLRGQAAPHGADWIYQSMGFWLMWMRSDRHLTLATRWRRREGPPAGPLWPVRLAQLNFATIYLTAGISKLADPGWIAGTAFRDTIRLPFFTQVDLGWLLPHETLLRALNYGIVGWEIAAPLLLLFRRSRAWALWSVVLFHVGIMVTLRVGWLGDATLTGALLLLDDVSRRRAVTTSGSLHPMGGWQKGVVNAFLVFHLTAWGWAQSQYVAENVFHSARARGRLDRTPVLSPYVRYIARIQYYDLWPKAAFFSPVRLLYFDATHPDGRQAALAPFDQAGAFAPGLRMMKEAREGLLMLRIARHGLTVRQWSAYVNHLIDLYQQRYGPGCPTEVRVFLSTEDPVRTGEPVAIPGLQKTLLVRASVSCVAAARRIEIAEMAPPPHL